MTKHVEKKVWFRTFGCQMNYHDTERMLSHLKTLNFIQTEDHEEADLILFNTCAIRDLANQKFYSHLGRLKNIKSEKEVLIGVAGCISQVDGKILLGKYPQLDFAFGPDTIDLLPDMIQRLWNGERKFVMSAFDKNVGYSIETRITHASPQAYVNIIKGCNNFCSYCIVPYTRGREKSRHLSEVVADVKKLVEVNGVQEITLLGQNVNSFGKDYGERLPELLFDLEKIDGLKLIRYATSHPYDMSDELIGCHATMSKLENHCHLPAQSGSNGVLARMNRKYTVEHYLGLVEKLRKAKPDIAITSDIIVGFPNETRAEFEETLELIRQAQFDSIYSYKFSPRPGTIAAGIEDKLSMKERRERLSELNDLQMGFQEENRKNLVGQKFRVLVEGKGTMKGETKWHGRTSCNRVIHFLPESPDENYQWRWVDLELTSATAFSVRGKLV